MATATIFFRVVAWLLTATSAAWGKTIPSTQADKTEVPLPEFIVKLVEIARNDPSFNTRSPLYVSKCRYNWRWLACRFDANGDGRVTRDEMKRYADLFQRLDRAGHGVLTAEDFDWTDDAPFVRQAAISDQIVRLMDDSGDGAISREEWQAAFDRLAGSRGQVTSNDLRRELYRPRTIPSDLPWRRVRGLLCGELGSIFEGPDLNKPAPNFTLQTQDGTKRVSLTDYRGRKPVVLIFGNYT